MRYIFSIPQAFSKYIEIEMRVENVSDDKIYLQLPSWRPGRYELGNFAKNIQRWNAFDKAGNELPFKKITKDKWEVETKGSSEIIIRYNYYASRPDAGGCWLDESQLYVNPVHCCMYVEGRKNEPCEVELKIPSDWKVAGSLREIKKNMFSTGDFDELVDSPFIASPSLKHHQFIACDKTFHIWIQGACIPVFERIEKDFKAFAEFQIKTMGDIPSNEYHFLIQVLPYKFYHGVEHLNSTVIAIGPGEELMTEQYNELVGVASHELFHVWNVKTIRPVEMLPYDYAKENYSHLGYVYEGFTTYYGDLFLARTGFFNVEQYLNEVSMRLQKHMDNHGRFNYSLAQSSFDTWLDGYVPGVPNRKTSIYDEGSLIALMLDFQIRKATASAKSLDDVMRILYNDFGKKKKGYSETDIVTICESTANISLKSFFSNYVYKAVSYDLLLEELLNIAGIEIIKSPSTIKHECSFGFRMKEGNKVVSVIPGSPAEKAGMMRDDEIVLANGTEKEIFADDEISFDVLTLKKIRTLNLKADGKTYFNNCKLTLKQQLNANENEFLSRWLGCKN
ncbi:MAG: M61 family metallopeptidase [Bacteroidia bacterium]